MFLYDIDGTLITLDKTGRWVYQKALSEVLGKEISIEHIDWLGTTDIEIIHKIVEENGFFGRESIIKMFQIFERISLLFKEIVEKTPEKLRILPYAYEIVRWSYENYYNCLLTGNIKEVAYMKLSPFGLGEFFPVGAFGDERKDRVKLVPMAIKRAEEYYNTKFDDFLVIGDSHRDIIAAKGNNIKSVVVPTGKMSKEELQKYQPDFLIETLNDLPKVVKKIEDRILK